MAGVAEHLSTCRDCRHEYAQVRDVSGPTGTLSFEWNSWLIDEHLEYGQKQSYVEGLMDVDDLEIARRHLEVCLRCREEIAAFIEDHRANESEFSRRQIAGDVVGESARPSYWRRGGLWSPLRAAALVLLTLSLAGLTASIGWTFWRGRSESDVVNTEAGPKPGPSVGAIVAPTVAADSRRVGVRAREARALRMTLSDQGRQLVLESRVRGVTGANDSELEAITGALLAEDISLPQVLLDLWGAEGSLRGPRRAAFELLRPRRELVRDTQPEFRWAALKDATRYEVFVADSRHSTVLTSGRLAADVREWRPSVPLIRGEAYSWTVSAYVRGEELISPTPADAEWKFRIMEDEGLKELTQFESRSRSHLARGVLYARVGLITEAESELQKLLSENPGSTAVRKLLERVQSWR